MSRLLVLLVVLVAATAAINVNFYALQLPGALTCSRNATLTLDVPLWTCSCFPRTTPDGSCGDYQKITLSGTNYTWDFYRDSACTTLIPSMSGMMYHTDACLPRKPFMMIKFTTSDVPTVNSFTCSASACTAPTNAPTYAPTYAPANATTTTSSGNSACKCPPMLLFICIDSCFSFSPRLHRNHVRLPWSRGSLDRVRLDSRLLLLSPRPLLLETLAG